MYIQVDYQMFVEQFRAYDRMGNFSHHALRALYDHFEAWEDDTEEPFTLDVIAICCEFSEEPLEDVLANYSFDDIDELYDSTMVVDYDSRTGMVLYVAF